MSRTRARVRILPAILFGLIGLIDLIPASRAWASEALLDDARIEAHGPLVELHFGIAGPRPRWHLEGHRQVLTLTLERTHLGLPAALLPVQQYAPLTGVHTMAASDGAVVIAIGVTGRVDYAVAFAPHDLIVRLARAGTAPDIAAPLVVPVEPVRPRARDRVRLARPAEPEPPPAPAPITRAASLPASSEAGTGELRTPRSAAQPPPMVASAVIAVPRPSVSSEAPTHPPLVEIDPGHGGFDPGTRSADGIAEKDLALEIATRLQRTLSGMGVLARMTRTDDRFLSLAERTQAANRAGADLFISIHLNSSPDPGTTGVSVYYLNNTTDRATIRLARMENEVAGGYATTPSGLKYILTDLRQGDKANESAALARLIEADSVTEASTALGARVNELGARQGPFYVLVGAEMPAVLVECGFLSNPVEAARLMEPRYQQALAEGIAAAVTHYFNADAAVGNL